MGMYTCLRFVGEIKKEFVNDIEDLINKCGDFKCDYWTEFADKYPFAKKFANCERCLFIPNGDISTYNKCKLGEHINNLVDNTWIFNCDLKDYGDEINTFLKDIAVNICDKFVAEIWYEEFDMPEIMVYNYETERLSN